MRSTEAKTPKGKVLDIQKYRIKKKIEENGLEWVEDEKGKFRIWIRLKNRFY